MPLTATGNLQIRKNKQRLGKKGGGDWVGSLNEIGDVHGHLLHVGVVEGLDVFHGPFVLLVDQIDGHPLPTKSAAPADPAGENKR